MVGKIQLVLFGLQEEKKGMDWFACGVVGSWHFFMGEKKQFVKAWRHLCLCVVFLLLVNAFHLST